MDARLATLTLPIFWPDGDLLRALGCLKVELLKAILREWGQPVSGPKKSLLDRIVTRLNELWVNDRLTFLEFIHVARKVASNPDNFRNQSQAYTPLRLASEFAAGRQQLQSDVTGRSTGGPVRKSLESSTIQNLGFEKSPFYDFLRTLVPPKEMQGKRDHFTVNSRILEFRLTPDEVGSIKLSGRHRIALFCTTAEARPPGYLRQLAYPKNPPSVLVNGKLLAMKQSLFMPLKNRPWSAKPMDLTDACFGNFLSLSQSNKVEIRWQQANSEKYFVSIELIERSTPEEIVQRYRNAKLISRESVFAKNFSSALDGELYPGASKEADEDLTVEQADMQVSVKDPITLARIQVPMRTTKCSHIQCFDALSFFMFNESSPVRQCTVCSKLVLWDELFVDGYFLDMINNIPETCDAVTIHPDGGFEILDIAAGVQERDRKGGANQGQISDAKQSQHENPEASLSLSDDEDAHDVVIVAEALSASRNRSTRNIVDVIELSSESEDENSQLLLNSLRPAANEQSNVVLQEFSEGTAATSSQPVATGQQAANLHANDREADSEDEPLSSLVPPSSSHGKSADRPSASGQRGEISAADSSEQPRICATLSAAARTEFTEPGSVNTSGEAVRVLSSARLDPVTDLDALFSDTFEEIYADQANVPDWLLNNEVSMPSIQPNDNKGEAFSQSSPSSSLQTGRDETSSSSAPQPQVTPRIAGRHAMRARNPEAFDATALASHAHPSVPATGASTVAHTVSPLSAGTVSPGTNFSGESELGSRISPSASGVRELRDLNVGNSLVSSMSPVSPIVANPQLSTLSTAPSAPSALSSSPLPMPSFPNIPALLYNNHHTPFDLTNYMNQLGIQGVQRQEFLEIFQSYVDGLKSDPSYMAVILERLKGVLPAGSVEK